MPDFEIRDSVLTFSDDCREIASDSFKGNKFITKVVIGKNVKSIGPHAFDGCSSLKEVRMDDGVEEIGACCFKACENLEVLYIPKTLKKVDATAFSVIFDSDPDNYGGLLDDGDAKVHEIHFSGLKADFYRVFNINRLFILDMNLSYSDMRIVCEDGEIALSNREMDF